MQPENEAYVYGLVLGRVLASLRERRGLSQGQLAAAAGITQSTLSRMERGQAQPDAFTLKKLAEALGVSVADLTAWVDKALERSRQATIGAIGEAPKPASKPWWQEALKVAGAAGLAGLVAFAVSAALDNPSKPPRTRSPNRRKKD
jgi:transcriptional regulator with XRE-family HTH domain